MEWPSPLRIVLAAAFVAAVCAPILAQTETSGSASAADLKVKPVPDAVPHKPFSPDIQSPQAEAPIEYRLESQMTEKDSLLAADAESSIGEHAGRIGLEFNQGKWSYQQVVCPALKDHIFLRFMRNNGTGDISVFSASIPRNGEGRVRIIPIQMRSYSLFSPAPINALTISAFNHIRAEESPDEAQDWLGTGLCYAALAGGHPVEAKLIEDADQRKFPAAVPAALQIPDGKGEVISFMDVVASPKLMEWTMTFNSKGKLLKASHSPVGWLKQDAVPPVEAIKGSPVPATIVELPGSPIPPSQLKSAPIPNN
ncbi:MAG: hypothetical protein ABR956_15945 [Terracidiphilus sp.]|jgi:hypothetical protein